MAETIIQLYANFIGGKYVDLSFFLSQIGAAFEKVKGCIITLLLTVMYRSGQTQAVQLKC
jgi:hypothetical protein